MVTIPPLSSILKPAVNVTVAPAKLTLTWALLLAPAAAVKVESAVTATLPFVSKVMVSAADASSLVSFK